MITFAALCQVSLLGADLKSLDQGLTDLTVKLLPKARIFYRGENIYIYIYIYIYIIFFFIFMFFGCMVRRSAPPPPPWSMVRDATPLLPPVGGVWGPSSPCGVVVGFWSFGFRLSF